MKIKTQLTCFIIGIIIVPLLCILVLPTYHYLSSPQRFLLKGYDEIRAIGSMNMTETDWEDMKEQLAMVPPNVQTIVYLDKTIVISTMPELPAGTVIAADELFNFIRTTSDTYDYQFQAPQRHKSNIDLNIDSTNENNVQLEKTKTKKGLKPFMVLSRQKVIDERKHFIDKFYISLFLVFIVFEAFCIFMVIQISRTITSSITILEKNTQRIAAGELDIELEKPKKGKDSNEITSLAESLEKMRLSLKEDQERRSRFIMGLSHDLRTPVALIKGYTEAISDGVVNNHDSVMNSLSIIHQKADQLESMINDLINYVKLNNTEWRQKLVPENIEKLLTDFAKTSVLTSEVYKRTINTSITINPNLKVPMDKTLFNRALENIFSNAMRYTKDGDTITISATESPENIIIAIEDTGVGISEKDIANIFDLFYRGTNSRREQGMGIGLSVVKNIIDTHGWNINVKSKLGEGTAFIITIPLNNNLSDKSVAG